MFDLDFVRSHFPALETPWALMDNAGGSAPCVQVADRVREHMLRRPVQLGASYPLSMEAHAAVKAGRAAAAALVGAEPDEIVLGASSTVLVQQLANSLCAAWSEGDEVIVTNVDHEANIGPWRKLEARGIVLREWCVNDETLQLELEDLEELLSERTRLVAFTHCSNILGSFVDVAAICGRIKVAGALSCVDGVAYAPHRRVDVKALGADFYFASLYKIYGPHLGLLYGRKDLLLEARSANHFFVPADSLPTKFEPGNVNYELAASLTGMLDYFEAVVEHHDAGGAEGLSSIDTAFRLFAEHEERLATPLIEFLSSRSGVQLVGARSASRLQRVPTISFVVEGVDSSEIPPRLEESRLAVRYGHFYAYRLIRDLGLQEQNGVVRISLVHYNTAEEVSRLVEALDAVT